MQESTFQTVSRILVNTLYVDEGSITLDSTLRDDLGADSLDAVELIMALEEEYNTEFDYEDTDKIITVRDIVALIDSVITQV